VEVQRICNVNNVVEEAWFQMSTVLPLCKQVGSELFVSTVMKTDCNSREVEPQVLLVQGAEWDRQLVQ
jgi:hypothetical protein